MGRKLALLIGTSRYDDPTLRTLDKVTADVEQLASLLRDPAVGAFDHVDPILDAPFGLVYHRISEFFVNADREDLLLLYFSGHGLLDDFDEPYLAVKDTQNKLLSGTGIPRTHITMQMDRSPSKQLVLILDCCYAGNLASSSKGPFMTAGAFKGNGRGRVILTASAEDQSAKQAHQSIPESRNSVYTHFIIQGLRTGAADTDGDGLITVNELHNYLHRQAVENSLEQTPQRWAEGEQGDIVIAANPNPSAQLPEEIRSAIESRDERRIMGAILDLENLLHDGSPNQQKAARAALERLTHNQNRFVSEFASQIIEPKERGRAPKIPDPIPVAPPSPQWRRVSVQAGLAMAAALVLGWATWATVQYALYEKRGFFATTDIKAYTKIQEGMARQDSVRSGVAELLRPRDKNELKDACAHQELKPGDLITFDKICACKFCELSFTGGPASGQQLTTSFDYSGSGLTKNATIQQWFQAPSSSTSSAAIQSNGSGKVSWTYVFKCTDAPGTWYTWIVDSTKSYTSDKVSNVVSANPSCRPGKKE